MNCSNITLRSIFLLLTIFVIACRPAADYSAEIARIHHKQDSLAISRSAFAGIPYDEVIAVLDTVKTDLAAIQENYVGEMTHDLASLFADYRTITKIVKNFDSTHKRIAQEFDRTEWQLSHLSEALETEATHDADGHEITPEYVKNALHRELEIADALASESENLVERSQKALDKFQNMHPKVKEAMQTMPRKKPNNAN